MTRLCFVAILASATTLTHVTAAPPPCDTTFDQDSPSDPFWKTLANWDPRVPGPDDVACITNNNAAVIAYDVPHVAKAIYIEEGSSALIYNLDSLKLCTGTEDCIASQIDGELVIYGVADDNTDPVSNLFLGDDVTVEGTGIIELENWSGPAVIAGESGVSLTIAGSITLLGTDGGEDVENGDVRVPLINNGTVIASEGILRIQEGGSGTGTWAAESDTGVLVIENEITGSGTWELTDHEDATIRFDADSRCLTGDVEIRKGTLHANQTRVITTGDLVMAPPGEITLTGTGTGASSAARVRFSGVKPGVCP